MKYSTLLAVGAFACASLVPALPVAAMDMSTVDCSQAASMMMMKPDSDMAMHSGAMPAASAMPAATAMASMTTDQAFDAMSTNMMHHGAMMAGMELKCGKDAKSRAMAAKLLRQLQDNGSMEAKDILNTYNH